MVFGYFKGAEQHLQAVMSPNPGEHIDFALRFSAHFRDFGAIAISGSEGARDLNLCLK